MSLKLTLLISSLLVPALISASAYLINQLSVPVPQLSGCCGHLGSHKDGKIWKNKEEDIRKPPSTFTLSALLSKKENVSLLFASRCRICRYQRCSSQVLVVRTLRSSCHLWSKIVWNLWLLGTPQKTFFDRFLQLKRRNGKDLSRRAFGSVHLCFSAPQDTLWYETLVSRKIIAILSWNSQDTWF